MTAEPHICPPDHNHGASETCYHNHQCKCTPCRQATMARRAYRRKLRAFGRYVSPFAPAAPVRARVLELMTLGFTPGNIAALAGIRSQIVTELLYGRGGSENRPAARPTENIHRGTAEKLLTIEAALDALPPTALIPATPTIRRVQALVCNGWSISRLSEMLDRSNQALHQVIATPTVRVSTHLKIADLYEQLWNVYPVAKTPADRVSVTKAKRYAAAHRWLPPMAWDDIDTDITPPVPERDDDYLDEVLIEIAMTGENVRLTTPERHEALARLNSRGKNDHEIAALLHIDPRSVLRIRQDLGIRAAVGADKQLIAA